VYKRQVNKQLKLGKMENRNSNSTTNSQSGKQSKSTSTAMQSSQLMKLFEDELMDIYWAEKALTKAIPKMVQKATSMELKDALESHLEQTHEQVGRVEMVFQILGKKAVAKKCEAMEGLIMEGAEIMEECEAGAMRDAGIITAGQKIEHYEISSYGTLRQFAETLGLTEAETLLAATLEEEKAADEKLSEVAQSINVKAAEKELESR
jgi:ferritin-like metal-binding protein YciE